MLSNYPDEIWKPIKDFEKYQVSNLGKVKNSRGWIMKPQYNKKGYLVIHLSKNNKSKIISLHRLVAKAFIPNPSNLPSINHIDEDKNNNCVTNLEWCTSKYNTRYSHAKKIKQYDINGNYMQTWDAVADIELTLHIPTTNVSKCCKGNIKTSNGFIFLYENSSVERRLLEISNRKHKSKSENVQ